MQGLLESSQNPQNTEVYTTSRYLSVIDRYATPAQRGILDASFTAGDIDLHASIRDKEESLKPEIDSLVNSDILRKEYDTRINDEKYFWKINELQDEPVEIRGFIFERFCNLKDARQNWGPQETEGLEELNLGLEPYIL